LNETDVLANMIHTSGSYTINITAHVADSGGISVAEIKVTGVTDWQLMVKGASGKFEYNVNGADLADLGSLTFSIHSTDKHGNEQMFSPGSIPISP